MTVLIVGATGLVGSAVCRILGKEGEVRALVRSTSGENIAKLREANCTPCLGDLREPESLRAACEGVDVVISTASSTMSQVLGDTIESVDHDGQLALVVAAEKASVKRFVFISLLEQKRSAGEPEELFPLLQAKRAVEDRLGSARMEAVVLRPNFFCDVWLGPALGWEPKAKEPHVRIYGDGTQPVDWIACSDVARAVAHASRAPSLRGKFELGGPSAATQNELAAQSEALVGGKVDREYLQLEGLRMQYRAATEPRQKSFFALASILAQGSLTKSDARLPGWEPKTSASQYLKESLSLGG